MLNNFYQLYFLNGYLCTYTFRERLIYIVIIKCQIGIEFCLKRLKFCDAHASNGITVQYTWSTKFKFNISTVHLNRLMAVRAI